MTEPKPKRHFMPYSDREVSFIKNNHHTMSEEEIAKKLDRSRFSVQRAKYKNNLLSGPRSSYRAIMITANLERRRMIKTNELVTEMKDLISQCENPEITLYKKAKLSARLIYLSNLKKII